ncbi:MAG TPA: tetratricopeptide repeat protein [Mycobacteriales bacterium]|nr:tetratricopeptide repeat protein [Mycobacteriales bacterium]
MPRTRSWANRRGAADLLERSLTLSRRIGDRQGEAETLAHLAEVMLDQDRHEEARARFEQSLAICQEVGDRFVEAKARCGLGLITATANPVSARLHWATALDLFTSLGTPEATEVRALLADHPVPAAPVRV